MVFTNVIVESFRKQGGLLAIFAFCKPPHNVLPNRKASL
jgi:hypothetical protein